MVTTGKTPSQAPSVFVIRVTDPAQEHKLLGYAFVQQTAFFPAEETNEQQPEIRITLDGLRQLFEKSGEFALAAVPFAASQTGANASLTIGANVDGANVDQ